MALTTSLVCPLVSPITGKTLQYLLRSSGRRHTSGQAVAALRGGSRRWQGDVGETGLTAEPWGPLARQGMCRGSICCQEDFRRCPDTCTAEGWWERAAAEQGRKVAWNKPEPDWGKLEDGGGKTFGGFTRSTWPAAGGVKKEALNMILEIIMTQSEAECFTEQRVLTEGFWLP